MTGNLFTLLAALDAGGIVGIAIGTLVVGALAGLFGYRLYTKNKIGSAKQVAARLLEEAKLEAASIRKDGMLDAKEQLNNMKADFEKETKEKRLEWQRTDNRLTQKEISLDKKQEILDTKENNLEKKLADLDDSKKELESQKIKLSEREIELGKSEERISEELQRVAGLTKDEASEELKNSLLESVKEKSAQDAKRIIEEAKDNANKEAQNIIVTAIQRCAADQTTENTISSVALPNEEMKGRIIGRMGRNIRALESATGVDVIIDDTPDVITLSSFDPVRREVARITLEKLISDGRVHPARIEEVSEKVRKEIDQSIKDAGEEALFEVGIHSLNPELTKILGRLKYRTSYGQNVLRHSIEVATLAAAMASELGINPKIAKRAGLLHDIGKAIDEAWKESGCNQRSGNYSGW